MGDDFVVNGVFLQAAYMFGLKDIGLPTWEEEQTTWSFGNGSVLLRAAETYTCTREPCTEGYPGDELVEATAHPGPHKLGSSMGYVTGIIVGDGVDPYWMIEEASVYLAYRYRTRLGAFELSRSNELKQVFEGGSIDVADEGNVITYTVNLDGVGAFEECHTSAVQPEYACRLLQ